MAFKKGVSGNKKGRPVGAINKTTGLQREFIQKLLDRQQDKIIIELEGLSGKEYFTAVTCLLEFILPKLQRSEVKNEIFSSEKQTTIIWAGKSISV